MMYTAVKYDILLRAMKQIAFPLEYFRKLARDEDAQMNMGGVQSLMNDANWLKSIAREVLKEIGEE